METVTMTMPENKKLQCQLQWQKKYVFHNDYNDNDEISKPKLPWWWQLWDNLSKLVNNKLMTLKSTIKTTEYHRRSSITGDLALISATLSQLLLIRPTSFRYLLYIQTYGRYLLRFPIQLPTELVPDIITPTKHLFSFPAPNPYLIILPTCC